MLLQRLSSQQQRVQPPGQHRAATPAPHRLRLPPVQAGGGAGGFGKSNKKKVDTSTGMVMPKKVFKTVTLEELSDDASPRVSKAADGAPADFPQDWVDLKFKAQDMPVGKQTKPFELASRTVMLYKFDGKVFCSDAASTAYQYPMTDAKLSVAPETGRVAAEVPLDGTVYDLSTGAVLKWCPQDTLARGLLGTLKSKETPVPLKVYPVHVEKDGSVWVKLR